MNFIQLTNKITTLAEIEKLVHDARALFVQLLKMSLSHSDTKGTCLYAVILCSTLINKFTDHTAMIRGGDGLNDGGLFIGAGGHGHYWIEIDIVGTRYIIDITADQFGLAPVIISDAASLEARYISGDQRTVDDHVEEIKFTFRALQKRDPGHV